MLRKAASLLLIAGSAAVAGSAPVQSDQTPVDLQIEQARAEAAAATAEQQKLEQQKP